MTSRVTDLDRTIAKNLKAMREAAGLTQPQVAGHLGISYQSYQKMEGGKHSFRVSTLDRLGLLYNKRLADIVRGETEVDPLIIKASWLLHGMDAEARDTCIRAILKIKQAGQ